ncbi:MAG: DUF4437 domain-containing protein [Pseudomonadota bacterium]
MRFGRLSPRAASISRFTDRRCQRRAFALLMLSIVLSACSSGANRVSVDYPKPVVEIKLPSEIEFIPLNPARGDASPQAGVLWGDIRVDTPSGVLLRFADGFSSPPHIHNITYRAVVIDGHIHNDDPAAEKLWMGPGSYWTQPAGEVHITAAKPGAGATAFLEILDGPYLVEPPSRFFDNGERPVNLVPSSQQWLGSDDIRWINTPCEANRCPEVAFLWKDTRQPGLHALLLRMPFDSVTRVTAESDAMLRMVIVGGSVAYAPAKGNVGTELPAGSYLASSTRADHRLGCRGQAGCLVYVRATDSVTLR